MSPQPRINTLSRRRRRIYFQLLLALFIIAMPPLFLYAAGYRFEGLTVWTKTGGIYVGAEHSDASIYIDGELVNETGTFRRGFFVDDLQSGTYAVLVSKEGYHPWEKTLPVYDQLVTEAQAFNLPEEPLLVLIPSTLTNQTTNATSTKIEPNPIYTEIETAFATTTATSTAVRGLGRKMVGAETIGTRGTSLTAGNVGAGTIKTFRGMRLYQSADRVVAEWMRSRETIPFYFCPGESVCIEKIVLNTSGEKPKHFDFFPGTADLVVVTLESGVYVTELDNRSRQNVQPLFPTPGADFRIVDGGIYVKTGTSIYKVEV